MKRPRKPVLDIPYFKSVEKSLHHARSKLITVACAYVPVDDTQEGCSYRLLSEAVDEYRKAVKESEKGQIIT